MDNAFDTWLENNPGMCRLVAGELEAKEQQENNALQIFESSNFGCVRAFMRDGEPWFVAKDVALALKYANPAEAIRKHCKYAELLKNSETLVLEIGPRGLLVIPEADVYALIFRSKLPKAEEFRDWVFKEVLPQIRKDGFYGVPQNGIFIPDFTKPDIAAEAWIKEYREKQAALEKANVLEECLGMAQQWKQIKALSWVPKYFKITRPVIWALLGKEATKLSKSFGYEIRKAPDSVYGEVNVYHVDVLKALLSRCQNDEAFMADYRK